MPSRKRLTNFCSFTRTLVLRIAFRQAASRNLLEQLRPPCLSDASESFAMISATPTLQPSLLLDRKGQDDQVCHIGARRAPRKQSRQEMILLKRIFGEGRRKRQKPCGELDCLVCGPFICMEIEDIEKRTPGLLNAIPPPNSINGVSVPPNKTSRNRARRGPSPALQYRISCLEFGYDPDTFTPKGWRGTDIVNPLKKSIIGLQGQDSEKKPRKRTNHKHVEATTVKPTNGASPVGRRTNNSLSASFGYDMPTRPTKASSSLDSGPPPTAQGKLPPSQAVCSRTLSLPQPRSICFPRCALPTPTPTPEPERKPV